MAEIAKLTRQITDYSKLLLIDDFTVNEELQSTDGNYKVIQTTVDKSITAQRNIGSTINNKWSTTDIVSMSIGDTIIVKFRVASVDDIQTRTNQFLFNTTGSPGNLDVVLGLGTGDALVLQRIDSGAMGGVAVDEDGLTYDAAGLWDLPYNKWITATFTLIEAQTISLFEFINFATAEHKFEVAYFSIAGETFNFSDATNDIIGDGTTTFSYVGTGAITYTDIIPSGYNYKVINGSVIKMLPNVNGALRPEQFGYDSLLNNDENVTNDCYDIITGIISAGFICEFWPRNYYISTGLKATENSYLLGTGKGFGDTWQDGNITRIYTDQNIDMCEVRGHDASGFNILFDGSKIVNHTKKLLWFNMSYDIRNPIWKNIYLKGNPDDLSNVLYGSYGLSMDYDDSSGTGYVTKADIDVFINSTSRGLSLPEFTSGIGVFRNENKIKAYITESREPVYAKMTDEDTFDITFQEIPGNLNNTQLPFRPMVIKGTNVSLSYRPYDLVRTVKKSLIECNGLVLFGSSLSENSYDSFDFNSSNVNQVDPVINPNNFNLPKNVGFISKLDNHLLGCGDSGLVTMDCYVATNEAWIVDDTKILTADNYLTATTANVLYEQKAYLLTSNRLSNQSGFRVTADVTDRELYFIEINIGYDPSDALKNISDIHNFGTSKIEWIKTKISGNRVGRVRITCTFNDGTLTKIIDGRDAPGGFFNSNSLLECISQEDITGGGFLNSNLERVSIRFHDLENEASNTFLQDIQVKQSSVYNYGAVARIVGADTYFGVKNFKDGISLPNPIPSNSTATDISSLVSDFNALLAVMRINQNE